MHRVSCLSIHLSVYSIPDEAEVIKAWIGFVILGLHLTFYKVKFTLQQGMKAQKGSRRIALFFL